jgi:hypothetical protein
MNDIHCPGCAAFEGHRNDNIPIAPRDLLLNLRDNPRGPCGRGIFYYLVHLLSPVRRSPRHGNDPFTLRRAAKIATIAYLAFAQSASFAIRADPTAATVELFYYQGNRPDETDINSGSLLPFGASQSKGRFQPPNVRVLA